MALGHASVAKGYKVRCSNAPSLIETLYHVLADNSVSKLIDQILRTDLTLTVEIGFAPMDSARTSFLCLIVPANNTRPLALAPTASLRSGVGTYPTTKRLSDS